MNTNSHLESGDEKEEQLSPQDEKDLEESAAHYHSDKDWSFLAKDTPKSLRETSPIRPLIRSKQQMVKSPEQEKSLRQKQSHSWNILAHRAERGGENASDGSTIETT